MESRHLLVNYLFTTAQDENDIWKMYHKNKQWRFFEGDISPFVCWPMTSHQKKKTHTLDGWNPAPVEVGSLSHYLRRVLIDTSKLWLFVLGISGCHQQYHQHLQHLTLEFHHIFHLIRSGGVLKALAAWGPWKPFGWLLRISPLGDFSAENTRGTPFYKTNTAKWWNISGPGKKKENFWLFHCFVGSDIW